MIWDRLVEVERPFGHEIEDRRRVSRHAHRQIGGRIGFGGRQATDIGEPVAHAGIDARHQLDVADAILEPDEIGIAVAKARQRLVVEDRIVAVIDDDAQPGGLAHRLDMRRETFLLRSDQIGRQQQQTISAGFFSAARDLDRDSGAIAATRNDGHVAPSLGNRGTNHVNDLGRRQ